MEGSRGCGRKGVLSGDGGELEDCRQVGSGWPLQPPGPEMESGGLVSGLGQAWAGGVHKAGLFCVGGGGCGMYPP